MLVEKCENLLNDCLKLKGKSANIYCIRSLLRAYNGNFLASLKDMDKAIELSEENLSLHFYVRALLFSNYDKFK